jgi:hypothetical protein
MPIDPGFKGSETEGSSIDGSVSMHSAVRSLANGLPGRCLSLVAMAALMSALACADGPRLREPEVTEDGLVQVSDKTRSRLWVRPDHHIGRYDQILIKGIGFDYSKGQERLEENQEAEIGKMLSSAMGAFTESGPVSRATEEGPCVVAVVLGLKDLRFHTSGGAGSNVSYVTSFGSATMIVEFRDSLTDQPLLRYAANRGLGDGPASGQRGADLKRLGRALGDMVTDMTNELQQIVPTTTVRRQTECHDGIYKLTGRG